jgi:hypothetical protein
MPAPIPAVPGIKVVRALERAGFKVARQLLFAPVPWAAAMGALLILHESGLPLNRGQATVV